VQSWQLELARSGKGIGSGRLSYCLGIPQDRCYIVRMDRSVAIANEFLRRAGKTGLTQMQLQKLVYFAHGWNLALSDEPLTSDLPKAWNYGPVYPDLYDHTKYFGKSQIDREITPDDDEAARFFTKMRSGKAAYRAKLSPREIEIIDRVWRRYGSLSGARLSALTHQPNTPWSQTFASGRGKNASITNELIKGHYIDLAEEAARPN
jgi:uncharacterized phage-associated protein